MLTDLLQALQRFPRLLAWLFSVAGVHEGVHEYCPGWCKCRADEDDLKEEIEWRLVTG